jgi:hypothetical protein
MAAQPDRPAVIKLSAQQLQQPELLDGLNSWLQLGLLSDRQVKQFCQEYLSCVLPIATDELSLPPLPSLDDHPAELTDATPDFADALPRRASGAQRPVGVVGRSRQSSPAPSLVARLLQSFMAEISVIWLLFLGVFMVVVSSGVLAASQWRNVSPIGQYGILLTYTLVFWATGIWTARQPNLRLTARMLQLATLLIIPVNFWMIDGLHLWQSRPGVAMGAIAALLLTGMTWILLNSNVGLIRANHAHLAALNTIALGWLHWGWAVAGVPLIASYVGTVGTALLLVDQSRQASRPAVPESALPESDRDRLSAAPNQAISERIAPATFVVAFAVLLLIGRAVLAAQVPIGRLGLALGICGWLFCWLTRRDRSRLIWSRLGMGLLIVGWAVSVSTDPPWQAIAVSSLGLWLLVERLQTQGRTLELLALLLLGLQTYSLIWRLIPPVQQQQIIDLGFQLAGPQAMPQALLGLAGIPYVWLILAVARWQRRQQHGTLAHQAEQMALLLGAIATLFSLANPALRSLNLLWSALTLAIVIWKRPAASSALIYLTHATALAALLSGIDWQVPLSLHQWIRLLLVGMAIEWGVSIGGRYPIWRRSAWHLGLLLAGLSYALLIAALLSDAADQPLLWLVTPALLTGLAYLRHPESRLATWLSVVALVAQLPLLIFGSAQISTWVLALSIATGLMLLNTHQLTHLSAAVLTIGCALGFEAALVNQQVAEHLTGEVLINLVASNLWALWLLRGWLSRQQTRLQQLYSVAANGWAIALCVVTLLALTFYLAVLYTTPFLSAPAWQWAVAAGLTTGAIAYRIGQQPSNLGFYGIAWSIETLVVILAALLHGSVEAIALINLALGLLTQIAADFWVHRSRRSYYASWHSIPLAYAAIGLVLAHHNFVAMTGLYTLAAALVGIGIGRRSVSFKPLTILAIFLASIAAYELLLYQLMQASGGRPGDGTTLLAGLAALIAIGDRLLQRWLLPYLRLTPDELGLIAHLHWGFGSGLAILALTLTLSSSGVVLWLGITTLLAAYALLMGRQTTEPDSHIAVASSASSFQDAWTYAGILEALLVISDGLYQAIPDSSWLFAWAGAIASGLAVGMNSLPWRTWGWSMRPWRTSAMILPAAVVLLTSFAVATQALLITGACYAWFAITTRQPRLSYLSIVLLDWAVVRFLATQGWLSPLWLSTVAGLSLLYLAQIDPDLQASSAKEQRHWLRSLATGLTCIIHE